MKFDYETYYSHSDESFLDLKKKTGVWKAENLCRLIQDEPTNSILEIGTGRGDVLNACQPFKKRIGADISAAALEQHKKLYATDELIKFDADKSPPLPFDDKEIDFVLLCDILEHVDEPENLLKEASRVGKYLLLKIPLERALLTRLMGKLRGTKYGPDHPAGHLHCWNLKQIFALIEKSEINVVRGKFIPTPRSMSQNKMAVKTLVLLLAATIDLLNPHKTATRLLIGGSYFAVATARK